MDPITYDFQVTIDPCRVGRYEIEFEPERLTYIIGDTAEIGGKYNFAEILSECNYPPVVTLNDLPYFVTHNSES